MNQMFDVFISYRRSDGAELAKVVRDYLTSRGLRVFLDTRELIDGQYFDTQLRERLIETPNYVLIATPEAFQFRKGEDWVREEMKLAVSEFKKNPQDRSVIPFVPNGTVFPESGLPEGLEDLPRFNRILLKDTKPTGAELLRLAKAICRVNRRNMWNAGQRVLERSKAEGSRFHLLHVDERIMPLYKKKDKRAKAQGATLPINVTSGESKEESSLRDALQAQQGSLYLIGEGGIGKTTAMISIMERHYKGKGYTESGEIPLFVELNGAPKSAKWYQGEDGLASDFIRREIARLFLGVNSIGKVPKDYISGMDTLFTKETESPEYLLLLDGLNEVSTDYVSDENGRSQPIRSLIIEEINYLLTECPNVRVMLTSRTDETEINCSEHGIEKLYLTGLHKDSITEYLESKKFSSREIKDALANERLFDCIRIPLFLTMFAALNKTKGVSSRGEIFSRFFHERSDELQSEYTQKNRLDSLKKDTVNKGQLRFILDFLLPAIACEMERRNDFKLTAEEAAKIILPNLEGKDANGNKPEKTAHPCAVIGEYGKQCFAGYKGSASLPRIAVSLLAISDDISEVAEYILTSAVDILGIFYRDDNAEYGFIHHHFRDYFAAVHDINLLRIAVQANAKNNHDLAFESLSSFIANANRREKSVFVGEILGEHHNKPIPKEKKWQYNVPTSPEDRNLLKRALDVFRGRFGEAVGYGLYNLIDPIKLVREDLTGSDFCGLDLSFVNFNGYCLGHTPSGGAVFRESKISMENLLCQGHDNSVQSIAYSPDGRAFLSGSWDNTIKEWDRATGLCIRTYKGHSHSVETVAYEPNGKTFISGSDDHTVKEWDRATGKCIRTYEGHSNSVRSVVYAPDGMTFLSGSSDCTVKEWDRATGKCIRTYEELCQSVTSIACAPDSKSFLVGTNDYSITEWNRADGQRIACYEGYNDGVINSLAFAPDGKTFLAGSANHTVIEWNKTSRKCICYKGHSGSVTSVAYAPDGKSFISGSNDNTIKEWNEVTAQCIRTYKGHRGNVTSVAYAPDGKTFLSGGWDNTVREWDRATEKCIRTYEGYTSSVNSVAYSPDGKTVTAWSSDQIIKEWDLATGRCVSAYRGASGKNITVAHAPNDKTFITWANEKNMEEWNKATNECICQYEHDGLVTSAVYSSDGKNILSASRDHDIRDWDRATGKCIHLYRGLDVDIRTLAYAPDGHSFITGTEGSYIQEWNRLTGELIREYKGHTSQVNGVSYAKDGKTMISCSDDGTVCLWSCESGECLQVIHNYSGLIVIGCDMRNLHKSSTIDMDILWQYGAIIDNYVSSGAKKPVHTVDEPTDMPTKSPYRCHIKKLVIMSPSTSDPFSDNGESIEIAYPTSDPMSYRNNKIDLDVPIYLGLNDYLGEDIDKDPVYEENDTEEKNTEEDDTFDYHRHRSDTPLYYDVTCPVCGNTICLDEDLLQMGEMECPNCGEHLEFDIDYMAEDHPNSKKYDYYDVTCPACGDTICLDEDLLQVGEMECPNCGEKIVFDKDLPNT